jgi:hypothetical protein
MMGFRVALESAALVIAVIFAGCGASRRDLGQLVATLPGPVQSMVAGATKLYACQYRCELFEIDPGGGLRRFAPDLASSTLLAAGGNQVFVTADGWSGGIVVFDTTGRGPRTIASGAAPRELLADDGNVYWIDYSNSPAIPDTVHAIRSDGTAASSLGPGNGLFQDAQALYWTASGKLLRAPKTNLSSQTQIASVNYPLRAVSSGVEVYWPVANQLFSTRVDGSQTTPVSVVTVPRGNIAAIALQGGVLYLETVESSTIRDSGLFTTRLLQIDGSKQTEIAHVDDVLTLPVVVAAFGGVFWAIGKDVYRVR